MQTNDSLELNEKERGKKRTLGVAKRVALIAVCASLIEGGKFALSFIPNVEIVTLLCAVFGYSFGIYGICSVYIFVGIETLIYGFNPWVISYLIYWPLVSLIFMLFGRKKFRNIIVLTIVAVVLTAFFGVLTSLVDVGLFTGSYANFFPRFAIYYSRGAVFYIIQIICNLVLFPTAFLPLVKVTERTLKNSLR